MITCELCKATVNDVDEANDAGWIPNFVWLRRGQYRSAGPACGQCYETKVLDPDDPDSKGKIGPFID